MRILTVSRLWLLLAGVHAGAGLVWWFLGAGAGFASLAGLHLFLLGSTLWPGSTIFCPARRGFGPREMKSGTAGSDNRWVVLTIDDGPCADTGAFLEVLDRYGAKALFFVIGRRAEAQPERVRAISGAGHLVENHTLTHPEKWFWAYGPARQQREIGETSKIIRRLTGRPPRWFRAPAGFRNLFAGALLRGAGLEYLGWTARGFDTSCREIPRILRRLRKGWHPGAVLLIHQGHPHSVALLEALLRELAAEGWAVRLPPEG